MKKSTVFILFMLASSLYVFPITRKRTAATTFEDEENDPVILQGEAPRGLPIPNFDDLNNNELVASPGALPMPDLDDLNNQWNDQQQLTVEEFYAAIQIGETQRIQQEQAAQIPVWPPQNIVPQRIRRRLFPD